MTPVASESDRARIAAEADADWERFGRELRADLRKDLLVFAVIIVGTVIGSLAIATGIIIAVLS